MLKYRDRYEKLYRAVPKHVLDPVNVIILDDYGKFFREFPDASVASGQEFDLWFKMMAHPKLTEEKQTFFATLLSNIRQDVEPALEAGLLARLVAADGASKIMTLLERYNEGEEIDLLSSVAAIHEQMAADMERKVKMPWVRDDIEDLLKDDENDVGFHWRLKELNDVMRPLRPGDFLIIAARPDKGKTSFLTDNLSFFAPQVEKLFPGQGRCIPWLNNEGPGNRIVKRLFQSALNSTASELVAKSNAGTVRTEFNTAMGGSDIVRVFDIHDFWNHEIEDILRSVNPAMVVFDMVDNIKFGGGVNNNGQRTDQLLEAMYQWARLIAVKFDCVCIATSQISADGENLAYPTLSMLKDSKTGKQGAADVILTLGARDDFENARYLGCTKNKLQRERAPKSPKVEVHFDGSRGRFNSVIDENMTHAQD